MELQDFIEIMKKNQRKMKASMVDLPPELKEDLLAAGAGIDRLEDMKRFYDDTDSQ